MDLSIYSDEHFMKQALQEAEQAYIEKEVPVGAIIVSNNRIIAKAHNQVERLQDATAHAEMLALTAAQNYLGSKYLTECTMYVTLEPCVMCAAAMYWCQLGQLVVGARDVERGFSRMKPGVLHPKTTVTFGLEQERSEKLVKSFFSEMRKKQN